MKLTLHNKYNYLNYSSNTVKTSTTTKNNSVTSQTTSSVDSAKASSSSLNTHEVKFIMENGMAEGAYVDGIKMGLADIFLTSKNQFKQKTHEKYNQTDVKKLNEILGSLD